MENADDTKISKEKEINIKNLVLQYLKDYARFIEKVAYGTQRKCPRLEVDDIKQQLSLALFVNTKSFDINKIETKNTYFSCIVITASYNIIHDYWRLSNKANIEAVSLDAKINNLSESTFNEIICEPEDNYYSPTTYYQEQEMIAEINKIIVDISSLERKVFNYYMSGYSVELIASLIHKSQKTVYNILSGIKEKIKNKIYK